MNSRLHAYRLGFRRTLPFQLGVIPFGLVYATLAVGIGMSWWLTIFLSVAVFGGSSQLVFVDLIGHLSSPFQAVLGANIVNARHLIYSAGVSNDFSSFPRRWKLLLSYLLTDQLYAMAEAHRSELAKAPLHLRPWFYLGSGFCTWIFWMASSGAGIFFGQLIPKSWNLGFSIPLMFMPMIFLVSKNKFAYFTVGLATALVFFLHRMPLGLGVLTSIIGASIVGFLIERRIGKTR